MSLVSGPGRGGVSGLEEPGEQMLHIEKHVKYIQSLDTVRFKSSLYLTPLIMLIC